MCKGAPPEKKKNGKLATDEAWRRLDAQKGTRKKGERRETLAARSLVGTIIRLTGEGIQREEMKTNGK